MKTAPCLLSCSAMFFIAGCMESLLNHAQMEQRIVQQFADAVGEENEPALRRIASSRFEEKAMASSDALTDLRVVDLPTGELSVVEVNDTKDGRREVIVKEEGGGKSQFHLVRDDSKGYWAVDDVVVRKNDHGTRVAKSTTEVMDLLATLRQFLDVWKTGSREEILAMTSPELTASLEPLPDKWMQALTAKIASSYEDGMARKPEASLNDNDAVFRLPARNGHLVIEIVRSPNGWLVDDVEAHNRREDNHPGSVRRQADAINAVNAFLTAYSAEDRETLQLIAGKDLFESALKLSDLSLIQLPTPDNVPAEFVIRAYESQLMMMIPSGKEIVRIHLKERPETLVANSTTELSTVTNHTPRFAVEEVTLYELATERQRSLSAVFTAPTRASVFLKALASRDHKMLSHLSTPDFARATWERVSPKILGQLTIPEFFDDGVRVTDSHTIADTTELEFVNARGQMFSCRMINQNGVLRLDDVQYPNDQAQITSLKSQLELSVPILEFATAWQSRNLELLQKSCSSDFNRLVWTHMAAVPEQFGALGKQLTAPIADTKVTQERATVRLSRPGSDSQVIANLVTEHDYWVVDEIKLEASAGQIVGVRQQLRGKIAAQLLSGSYSMVHSANGNDKVMPVRGSNTLRSPDSQVQQASAEFSFGEDNSSVNHAVFHQYYAEGEERPTSHPAPVHPASGTETNPGVEQSRSPKAGRVSTAGYQRSVEPANGGQLTTVEAKTTAGVQVFGPQAAQVAKALDSPTMAMPEETIPAGTNRPDLNTPIDMTPGATGSNRSVPNMKSNAKEPAPAAPSGADIADPESDFMYFGPDVEAVKKSASVSNPTLTPPTAKLRRITEPADAPISID